MIELSDLKTSLDISDSSKDNQLNLAISNAKGFVKDYLWYSLEYSATRVASFFWNSQSFDLPFTGVFAVSTIEQGDDEFSTLTAYSWDKKVYKEEGLVKTKLSVGPYTEITYAFWYDSGASANNPTPAGLKAVLLSIASKSYKNMWEVSMGDMKSETVDGDTITLKDTILNGLSETEMNILDNYKRYGFSA